MKQEGVLKSMTDFSCILKRTVITAKPGIQKAGDSSVQCDGAESQRGSVLVVALLILVFLTLIGISATTITEIEIQIAGNERAYNLAFYTADSGVYLTPKIVRRTVEDGARPSVAVTYNPVADDGSFFRRIMGYDTTLHPAKDFSFTPDSVTNTQYSTSVDVARDRQVSIGGGGVEFGSGSEGVGVGSAGGVAIIYQMTSTGAGPNNATSNIAAEYRLVPGVAGGL